MNALTVTRLDLIVDLGEIERTALMAATRLHMDRDSIEMQRALVDVATACRELRLHVEGKRPVAGVEPASESFDQALATTTLNA